VATAVSATSLWERNYVLVLVNQLLAYVSNQTIIPVIPLFLVAQGHGESFVGLVIAAFNVTSFSARPIFGRWVDRGQPRAAQAFSCVLLTVASWAYLIPNMLVLFLVRGLHGLGWAGINTAASAWVAHLVPANRRAEGVGYFTVTQSCGIAFAPVLGIWLFNNYGPSPAFIVAGGFALAALIVILRADQRRVPRAAAQQPASTPAPISSQSLLGRVIEPTALLSTSLLSLMQFNVAVFSTYVPLYFLAMNIPLVELFFLATGVASMLGRGSLGRFADRIGRFRSITLGSIIQIGGLLLMGQSADLIGLTAGGIILTLGQSVSHPSLYALVIDRAPAERRGAALATYTMGFQLGSGVGAVVYGFVIQYLGYHTMYQLSLLPVIAALITTLVVWRKRAGDAKEPVP
jgi:MFS family permease